MQPPDRAEARALRNLRITSESRASPEDAAIIHDGLARFNVAATKHTYYSPVAIFLGDDRDAVLGGALGARQVRATESQRHRHGALRALPPA